MGREAQPPHSRLTPRLEADLPRINFYRFCQLLEKRRPGQPLMGRPAIRLTIRCVFTRIREWDSRQRTESRGIR
jgi:predicted component of type VI protein secretion system